MKNSILELYRAGENLYQAFIKNNHGRKIYICLSVVNDWCQMKDCFYIDRTKRPTPKLFKTTCFWLNDLTTVIANELDKSYAEIQFSDGFVVSKEDFIKQTLQSEKYNILILLKKNNTLKTIFKNRHRRSIYLEIQIVNESKACIMVCKYCDARGTDADITPYNLITIYFHPDKDFKNLLKIVNDELEGGFTDVIITDNHTIVLDRPICGSI